MYSFKTHCRWHYLAFTVLSTSIAAGLLVTPIAAQQGGQAVTLTMSASQDQLRVGE
jgi:hypothetical protein